MSELWKDRIDVVDSVAEGTIFVGATAAQGTVIFPQALGESFRLRNLVYEKLNWRDPADPFKDEYDDYSLQLSVIKKTKKPKVNFTFRVVTNDDKFGIGLPLEKDFPDLALPERRVEVSRLVSITSLKQIGDDSPLTSAESKVSSSLLYAKACQAAIDGNYEAYALLEEGLFKLLTRYFGVKAERITDGIIIPEYNNTENFVIKIDPAETRARMLNNVEKITGTDVDLSSNHFNFTGTDNVDDR